MNTNMKLVWKGLMSNKNKFVYDELPKDSKKLFSKHGQWVMYLLIIPIFLIAYIGINLYNWNDVFEIIVNCWCSSITVLFGST
mgnify:CR=1 FL=1